MTNGELEHFLDTGWWNTDTIIYYHDFVYMLEGFVDGKNKMHVRISKWRAKNIDNKTFESIIGPDNDFVDFSEMEMEGPNEDALREKFLKAKIWDGKSFWEVEKELAWLDW